MKDGNRDGLFEGVKDGSFCAIEVGILVDGKKDGTIVGINEGIPLGLETGKLPHQIIVIILKNIIKQVACGAWRRRLRAT